MNCPNCQKEMINLGNVFGIIYTTYPAQWNELHVCDDCKIQKKERVTEQIIDPLGGRDLSIYQKIN